MKQKIISRLIYLSLLLISIFLLWACKEDSNPVDTNTTFASATKTITPQSGGTIELTNKNGDQIKLTIPAYAIQDTTAITLEILNDILANPFSQNLLSTIRILPDGLKLDSAATLTVIFKSTISDTSYSILYYRKRNDLAYPLETRWLNNYTVVGKVFHFSDYGGAKPTKEEVSSQSNKLNNDFNYSVWDLQGFQQYICAMLKYIEFYQMYGEPGSAQSLIKQLEQKIINQVNAFLNIPIPNEPCGYYLNVFLKYHEYACTMVEDGEFCDSVSMKLTEIYHRCFTRGELDFEYNYCVSAEGAEICRTITGTVPFVVNIIIEPELQINGTGVLDWSGTMNGLPPNCFYNEVGTVNVTLGGEMVEIIEDDSLIVWMDFEILEHATGTVTAGCQGAPPQVHPFNPPDVTHNIRMLAEEGTQMIMPIPGANGSFKWTLHLNYMPPSIAKDEFIK